MPNIKPISDLRNYSEVLHDVAVGAPVFLTKNGRGRYAILDMQDFEKTQATLRLMNELAKGLHKGLTGGLEELEILYEPSVTAAEFEQKLAQNRDRDLRMKLTSVGPHRDDFCVKVNGIDIRKYGSQGQQRTAALSLKLSEIYLVKKKIKDTPVLLLDDVLSELDSNRQTYLLESIHDIQTLITCTGLDDFVSHQFEINRVFQVIKGHVYMPKGF